MQRLVLRMQFKNMGSSLLIRQIDLNMTIKAAGTQQSAVQHLLAVRRRHQQNARCLRRIYSVHFRQQLIQRLIVLPLLSALSFSADYVNLIDKNNSILFVLLGCPGARLFKQLANPPGAYADIHFHEFTPRCSDEDSIRVMCCGFGHQRLARTRRTRQQNAFNRANAESLDLFVTDHEIQRFLKLLLGAFLAADFRESQLSRAGFPPFAFLCCANGDPAAAHFQHHKYRCEHEQPKDERNDIITDKSHKN
ncbi:hypothetical protein D3C77_380240 [compost metagenome]